MEAKEATRTSPSRTEREDFQATSDPALQSQPTRARSKLLGYDELYELWERQQWLTQDLDFSQDRIDWHERIPEEERFQRHVRPLQLLHRRAEGRRRARPDHARRPAREPAHLPRPPRSPTRPGTCASSTASSSEVGVLDGADELKQRLDALEEHLNPAFNELFDDLLKSRVDRLAEEPGDQKALIEAVTLYHMVIEGMLALTGQHFIIDYNEREGTLPGFVEGFSNVARDEHRHIAFGVRFLTDAVNEDEGNRAVIQGMLEQSIPVADKVIDPPWADEESWDLFGVSQEETHAFAATCLSRRLKVIGLV